ncbi:NitT/TauT family transport system permease protein [Agrococcus baldri]|uniref:NitT/TauT family transport system permease protein n=1 Tax=Agrococcus baldri TaxID=153730 RepID=A0AA94HK60_9MICO|nr:ABC transporter permease [Agrococcus baldri]SFR98711.1 NitT/TauT family transport system permease protein [Agrococcus baldri]
MTDTATRQLALGQAGGRKAARRHWSEHGWVRFTAPAVLGAAALGLWEAAVHLLDIQPYLLPAPSAILDQLVTAIGGIAQATLATGTNALIGLLLGAVVAVVTAALASRLRWIDQLVAPLVAAIAVVPIVALAPVLQTMYGATSEMPRILVVAIASFVPVFITTLRGLRQVRPVHLDLMRAYGASGWQATRIVTLPGAVPYVFGGLTIASSIAVISAVVAEYFGGLQNGLGSRIASAAAQSGYPRAWAYVVASIVLGLVFYGVTLLAERLASRWAHIPIT